MIDWQSYLDGEMNETQRAEIEARLTREPLLRKELEGYKAFIGEIKKQGSATPIPSHKLHDAMDSVLASKPASTRWWLRPSLAMVSVFLLVFMVWALTKPTHSIAKTPVAGQISKPDPAYASQWIKSKTGLRIPVLSPSNGRATIVAAKYGRGWASIDYQVGGERLTLYIANLLEMGDNRPPHLYVNEQGTSWQAHGLAYYLEGTREARALIVDDLIAATRSEEAAKVASEPC